MEDLEKVRESRKPGECSSSIFEDIAATACKTAERVLALVFGHFNITDSSSAAKSQPKDDLEGNWISSLPGLLIEGARRVIEESSLIDAKEKPLSEVCKLLVKQLGADQIREREAAQQTLARIGVPALPALLQGCTSGEPEVRRRCDRLAEAVYKIPELQRLSNYVAEDNRLSNPNYRNSSSTEKMLELRKGALDLPDKLPEQTVLLITRLEALMKHLAPQKASELDLRKSILKSSQKL